MSADRQARKNRNVRPSTQIARIYSQRRNHGSPRQFIDQLSREYTPFLKHRLKACKFHEHGIKK